MGLVGNRWKPQGKATEGLFIQFCASFFRHVGGDLAGYAKTVGNFTAVLVRNAGHMVPYDQPKWAFDLINRFTSGKSFNTQQ